MVRWKLTAENKDQKEILKLIEQAYTLPGWYYTLRGFFILIFAYRISLWTLISFFEKHLSDNHLEIPIGTGTGFKLVLWLRKWHKLPSPKVVAVDYSSCMVKDAQKAFAKNPLITVEQGDVAHLRFADKTFLSVGIANGFHCFPDPDAALAEVYRVLLPGGKVAANVILHPTGIWPFKHIAVAIITWGIRIGLLVSPFDKNELRAKFVKHGFVIVEDKIVGNTQNIVALKPR